MKKLQTWFMFFYWLKLPSQWWKTKLLNISTASLYNTYSLTGIEKKGSSSETIVTTIMADNSHSPTIKWYRNVNFCFVFKRSCLKQEKTTFTPIDIINLFIVYELERWSQDLSADFSLKDWLFRDVKLWKILIHINILIQDKILNLILVHFFYVWVLIGIKMLLFLE